MDKYLYPTHPVRCIFTGPSECGQSYFLTNFVFKKFLRKMIEYKATHHLYIMIYLKK